MEMHFKWTNTGKCKFIAHIFFLYLQFAEDQCPAISSPGCSAGTAKKPHNDFAIVSVVILTRISTFYITFHFVTGTGNRSFWFNVMLPVLEIPAI